MLAGAAQLSEIWALPALALRPVGAPGGVPLMGEAVMVTLEVAVFTGAELSLTVRVAVKVPAELYVWLGFWTVLVADPSPKFQLKLYGGVPPVAVPVKAMFSGTWPEVGAAEAVAASGLPTALTLMATVDVAVFAGEELSVTVSVAVQEHAELYVWLGFCAVLVEPSPKFQLNEYGAVPPVAEPVNDTASGALPVVGAPEAVAESGVAPWIQMSSSGSPRPDWSAVVMGNVARPMLLLGSITPGWTLFMTRSIAARILSVRYAT